MPYSNISRVLNAGVATNYGGHPKDSGAVFVFLRDTVHTPPIHDRWFEVKEPWGKQGLATALAAITASKRVLVEVGADGEETDENGELYCYKIYIIAE